MKRKHPWEEGKAVSGDLETLEQKPNPVKDKETEEEDEDEDANDPIRLWEDGWKHRYYKVKFDIDEDDFSFRRRIAHHYTIGLKWVLKYYKKFRILTIITRSL